jgi:mannose-1-phosphate guanylyltransferase
VNYVDKSKYQKKIQLINEDSLKGTAGTLLHATKFFKKEPLILIHADNLSVFDLKDFINAHQSRPKHCDLTMMLFETPTPESCGIVTVNNSGVLTSYVEKPVDSKNKLANAAIYILEYSLIEEIHREYSTAIDFSNDIVPDLINRTYTYINTIYHRDIGTVDSYKKAQKDYLEKKQKWGDLL